jgi:CubicO group peptidase (beta-lactamase class C family)
MKHRINDIILLMVLLTTSCLKDEPLKLPYQGFGPRDISDGWILSCPSMENMDSLKLDGVFRHIYREDEFYLIRSMIILRNGRIVGEVYPGDPKDIHQIQNIKSVTKSFTGILACIALQNGLLDSLDERLSDLYPDCFVTHPDRTEITLEQALTMRTGLVRENKGSGYEQFFTSNTVDFALSSPQLYEPGTTFYYSDINPQLVSYAIQRKYGRSLEEYAEVYLFGPLGITEWYWQAGRDGVSFGSSNLNLKPRDMARFGQMLLQNGRWGDTQILDSAWVGEATRSQVQLNYWAYGYYFWINPEENVYWAAGHGGQSIFVAPEKNLVVVVTAWPYVQDREPWKDNFEFELYKRVLASCN